MHHFRKKSSSAASPTNDIPSTPTLPIVEHIKKELATFYPRTKDPRALVASSSALALSIASPSCDPTGTASNESESPGESAWRAAYGAAKMVVEIAKDSSDMLPPLKAVMVALAVLIKNCDQTMANADQIGEIEERIQSLGGILASPVGDQDTKEKARREALRRKLAGIIAKLGPLSEQYAIVKFLKNTDHASILNGFVQDLTYAVTDYQTSLQQSIHENTKKIDETTHEINVTTNKIEEMAKDIDKTIRNIDESAQNIIEAADLELLGKLEPVRNAGHQAGHHHTCLRGTRESVLDGIMRWAKDPQDKHVFWLNGLAGTGKSTIAQTFSEMVAGTEILGASFFCSRDYFDRRELKNIFPTLAYQLACRYPTFRRHIISVIKQDPTVASNSLIYQLKELIVGPLSSSNLSCVIVVDALDECIDDQPASAILSVLGRHIMQLLSVKFFITGRPEPRIRTGFRLPLLEPLTQVLLLHEVNPSSVDKDIRLYLQEKLTAVSKRRSDLNLSDPWPCGEDLTTLTNKTSGLFIFASTLVRFIESEHHEPNERLQLIITPSDSTVHEGRAGIDPLYTQILVHAFSDVQDSTVFADLRKVLGAVVLASNPLSRIQIAGILNINQSLVTRSLRHLHSVLFIPNEDSENIRAFHKSFPDFLQDHDRCPDPKFFIDSPIHHGDIALDCLRLLKKLKSNPCDLPDFMMNRDVANLPDLLENQVGSATRYACGYWALHLRSSPTTSDPSIRLVSSVTEFFQRNAVPWIEVMSLENQLESVIHSIYHLLDWLGTLHVPTSDLRRLAQDCLRFTMHFFHLIQQSASHIYHSALPLSPESSKLRSSALPNKSRIIDFHGQRKAWGITVRTITANSKRFTSMTTFGHRIAASCDDGTVGIHDSITGVLRLSLSPADPVHGIRGSPDGSTLFCAHKTPSITAWDMQTGGLIHTLILDRNAEDIAVSLKGRYLACGLSDKSVKVWEVAEKMEGAAIWTRSPVTGFCWLQPEEQIVVTTRALVGIWDIVSGTALHSFPIGHTIHHMAYSKTLNQLAVAASFVGPRSVITFIDPQTGTFTLNRQIAQKLTCLTFSQTTEELICGMEARGPQLFDLSTRSWRNLGYPDTITSISPLQNGTVAANFVDSGLQLLNLDRDYIVSQESTVHALTIHALDGGRLIAILPISRDRIVLLRAATASKFVTIPIQNTDTIPIDGTPILCASLRNHMAVYYFEERERGQIQLWESHQLHPRWTAEIVGLPLIATISPFGNQLVTFYKVDNQTFVSTRNTRNGQLQAQLRVDATYPLNITFYSETGFYSHHEAYRIAYFTPQPDPTAPGYSLIRSKQLPWVRRPKGKRYYDVDDAYEWVVSGSTRICWIPPGYIRSVQPGYCWAGDSLFMAGTDGKLRGIAFQEHSRG